MSYETRRITYLYEPVAKSVEELVAWSQSLAGPRLLILNTVQSAAVVAQHMAKTLGMGKVEHLSTALTAEDREKTLDRIKKRLRDKGNTDWTLVATSCVEAGVNLSFRNGLRECGSLLSLLQAAGRVDREGIYRLSEMWTFNIQEDGKLIRHPGMEKSANVLRSFFDQGIAITPALSTRAITDEIALYGNDPEFAELARQESIFGFETIAKHYQIIDNDSQIVIVDKDLADRVRAGYADWRDIQRRAIQISRYKLDKVYRTPRLTDELYIWNLAYDDFLGYMAGVLDFLHASLDILINSNI